MLFTFPSRYWYTIGLRRVFSLGGWARRIHAGFHVPRATRDAAMLHEASCTGLSPSADRLSRRFHSPRSCNHAVPQPREGRNLRGLGSAPFARRYWGYHVLFSLPPGTKMFQFPGFASPHRRGYGSFTPVGCPIRTSADQRSPAPTRSFSQLATSFVAFLSHRHPPCALSCFLPCITCGPVRTRRAYLRLSRVICLFFPSLFQYVKVRRPRHLHGEHGGE